MHVFNPIAFICFRNRLWWCFSVLSNINQFQISRRKTSMKKRLAFSKFVCCRNTTHTGHREICIQTHVKNASFMHTAQNAAPTTSKQPTSQSAASLPPATMKIHIQILSYLLAHRPRIELGCSQMEPMLVWWWCCCLSTMWLSLQCPQKEIDLLPLVERFSLAFVVRCIGGVLSVFSEEFQL